MKNLVNVALIGLVAAAPRVDRSHSDAVYSCQSGYTLQGKTCVRKHQVPGNKVCLSGNLMNGQCITQGQVEQYCPPETTPVAGGCQIKDVQMPTTMCPPGTHDIGGACQTYSIKGIEEVCRTGVVENGECAIYESVPALKKSGCPIGYEEAKGSCWKSVQMDCTPPQVGKRLLQAKGSVVAHGKGFVATPAPVAPKYVPGHAKLQVKSKQCEVKLEADPVSSTQCPAGSVERQGQCVIRTVEPTEVRCSLGADYLCFPHTAAPGIEVCQPGYQLRGGICERVTILPKESRCAEGSMPGPNGGCIRFMGPPVVQCPPSTQQVGEDCISTVTAPPTVQVTVTCTGKNCYN